MAARPPKSGMDGTMEPAKRIGCTLYTTRESFGVDGREWHRTINDDKMLRMDNIKRGNSIDWEGYEKSEPLRVENEWMAVAGAAVVQPTNMCSIYLDLIRCGCDFAIRSALIFIHFQRSDDRVCARQTLILVECVSTSFDFKWWAIYCRPSKWNGRIRRNRFRFFLSNEWQCALF